MNSHEKSIPYPLSKAFLESGDPGLWTAMLTNKRSSLARGTKCAVFPSSRNVGLDHKILFLCFSQNSFKKKRPIPRSIPKPKCGIYGARYQTDKLNRPRRHKYRSTEHLLFTHAPVWRWRVRASLVLTEDQYTLKIGDP